MTDPLYREIIIEHWKHPQNYGIIKHADIDVTDFNPLCGDEIRITANREDNKITNIKFTSQGCAISKASASIFTEMVKGQNMSTIKHISSENLLSELGVQLTPARMKCALLGYTIFQNAF